VVEITSTGFMAGSGTAVGSVVHFLLSADLLVLWVFALLGCPGWVAWFVGYIWWECSGVSCLVQVQLPAVKRMVAVCVYYGPCDVTFLYVDLNVVDG